MKKETESENERSEEKKDKKIVIASSLIIIDQVQVILRFKSQHIIFIVGKHKEISMLPSHSLTDALELLQGIIRQEGASHQTHSLLSLLQAQLPHLLHKQTQLQQQLTQKTTELKQVTRKLKKTTSKLEGKTQECDSLKNELQRVNRMYSQKIDKLVKYQKEQCQNSEREEKPRLKEKGKSHRSFGTSCDILNQTTIKELSAQNKLLKERLQQAQIMLMEERAHTRAITIRLEEMQMNENYSEADELKDNSTLDADSLKGDPFQADEQWEEAGSIKQPLEIKKESWWLRAWRNTWNMYDTIVQRL